MRYERSAGAVVFKRESNKTLYLLLKYKHKSTYYGFPRGNMEGGEEEKEAARREIKEETNLDVEFVGDFRETTSWFYRRDGDTISKRVVFFLAEAKPGKVEISHEHYDFKWLPFEKAVDVLEFENAKRVLRKVQDFLFNRYKTSLKRWTK